MATIHHARTDAFWRKEQKYDDIYSFDLGGNVRKNTKLSGTTRNVFDIQVGVGSTFPIRKRRSGILHACT